LVAHQTRSWGYERPVEDELVVRLTYSSEPYRVPPGMLEEKSYVYSFVPGPPNGGLTMRLRKRHLAQLF
jgi:hypothetical protein